MKDIEHSKSLWELTELVVAQLNCAASLVTQVTHSRQELLANSRLTLPARLGNTMPLSHSICQHVVAMDFPLAIDDTVYHPLLKGNLAFSELGIAAYLGAPLHGHGGIAVGAVCALEFRHRRWSSWEIGLITHAAEVADGLVAKAE